MTDPIQSMLISDQTIITASSIQVSTQLNGEAVILSLQDGQYYGLDQVGADVWNLIQEPIPFRELHAALLAEYEVDADDCRQDVLALLETLSGRGLIEVRNEDGADRRAAPATH